ncbi:MAG: hypothetical protein K2W85_06260 [Phycisphaerales bacterium]|nr:hypothetical protein [Phycisphaerales bacterium]
MALWLGWYPQGQPEVIANYAPDRANLTCAALEALPPGHRCLLLRWVLIYESYHEYGADPVAVFERGGFPVSKNIRFLRALGREIRRRGLTVDGIYMENEGAPNSWALSVAQMSAILASPAARARMPQFLRNARPSDFDWQSPNFQRTVQAFNNYGGLMLARALRQITVDSGIFRLAPGPGRAPVQPPTVNFNFGAPTFPVYDENGWRLQNLTVDRVTSAQGLYLGSGRYFTENRVHHGIWNGLINSINVIRSCMRRPNAKVWPTIAWPSRVHPWVWEQLIAHGVRTGVNWTMGNNAWLYWREPWLDGAAEDGLAAEIMGRHDQPFPVRRDLGEIPFDCDQFETAGYVTTYTDFMNEVLPSIGANVPDAQHLFATPRMPRLVTPSEMAVS